MAFSKSFGRLYRPAIELRTAEDECCLDKHFRGTLRIVVHQIDLLASNNAQRFVFADIKALTKLCRKFGPEGSREEVSERTVKYALAYLRDLNLVSKFFRESDSIGGVKNRKGFTVVPHHFFSTRRGKRCIFRPGLWPPLPSATYGPQSPQPEDPIQAAWDEVARQVKRAGR